MKLINNENVIHVKYENICRTPAKELKKICSFLDIKFESVILDFKNNLGHTVMGNRLRFNNSRFIDEDLTWKKNLQKKELSQLINDDKLIKDYGELGDSLK